MKDRGRNHSKIFLDVLRCRYFWESNAFVLARIFNLVARIAGHRKVRIFYSASFLATEYLCLMKLMVSKTRIIDGDISTSDSAAALYRRSRYCIAPAWHMYLGN